MIVVEVIIVVIVVVIELCESQFLWTVVDFLLDRLSAPPVVAQTVGSQQTSTMVHATTISILNELQ